jgi:hypothetical protein
MRSAGRQRRRFKPVREHDFKHGPPRSGSAFPRMRRCDPGLVRASDSSEGDAYTNTDNANDFPRG